MWTSPSILFMCTCIWGCLCTRFFFFSSSKRKPRHLVLWVIITNKAVGVSTAAHQLLSVRFTPLSWFVIICWLTVAPRCLQTDSIVGLSVKNHKPLRGCRFVSAECTAVDGGGLFCKSYRLQIWVSHRHAAPLSVPPSRPWKLSTNDGYPTHADMHIIYMIYCDMDYICGVLRQTFYLCVKESWSLEVKWRGPSKETRSTTTTITTC